MAVPVTLDTPPKRQGRRLHYTSVYTPPLHVASRPLPPRHVCVCSAVLPSRRGPRGQTAAPAPPAPCGSLLGPYPPRSGRGPPGTAGRPDSRATETTQTRWCPGGSLFPPTPRAGFPHTRPAALRPPQAPLRPGEGPPGPSPAAPAATRTTVAAAPACVRPAQGQPGVLEQSAVTSPRPSEERPGVPSPRPRRSERAGGAIRAPAAKPPALRVGKKGRGRCVRASAAEGSASEGTRAVPDGWPRHVTRRPEGARGRAPVPPASWASLAGSRAGRRRAAPPRRRGPVSPAAVSACAAGRGPSAAGDRLRPAPPAAAPPGLSSRSRSAAAGRRRPNSRARGPPALRWLALSPRRSGRGGRRLRPRPDPEGGHRGGGPAAGLAGSRRPASSPPPDVRPEPRATRCPTRSGDTPAAATRPCQRARLPRDSEWPRLSADGLTRGEGSCGAAGGSRRLRASL